MPYIEERYKEAALRAPATVGELTYAVQQLLKGYIHRKRPNYQTYAECLAALTGAQLDLWDRKVQPHEVAKRKSNGDVW